MKIEFSYAFIGSMNPNICHENAVFFLRSEKAINVSLQNGFVRLKIDINFCQILPA